MDAGLPAKAGAEKKRSDRQRGICKRALFIPEIKKISYLFGMKRFLPVAGGLLLGLGVVSCEHEAKTVFTVMRPGRRISISGTISRKTRTSM